MEIQKKQFTYRGKTVDELKELEVREFAKYLPSREKRTVLRNFQMIEDFVKRAKTKIEKGKKIRTHSRNIIIVPKMIGMTIHVHNGKNFNQVHIEPEMLGHRLGEMSGTRSKVAHSKAGVGATKGSKHKAKK
ncbi:MAG: 30S ribosomal protein S19 [Candidatus Diapherotrites archaeon ADurb.Bin253]|jgi:small subunit ribosomal protein S19|nr:30S ribosomal protein S19 [Candidatus Pacearchaeota archaeon]OQA68118.1 MAG: 30S ribosomal protein S19 [Candidatus Diapherotrites archaeon ADurb.Bin253]HNZ52255.1 30S ribosomal protein S19 [Candidatus Pacearchaeota archaeon]HOC96829.1 30S ribosomal protein S19 [Candidatus Pacearchaeota archaeon]HOF44210.1 30S ribosomal protein S19 [Candidatus Pacearchaeota archaeon]